MSPRRAACLLGMILLLSLAACGGDKSVSSDDPPVYTELQWVGTEVVYRDTPGKKDVSIVFVLADWCGWCRRLKQETLADTTVIRMLGMWYNIVNLNPDLDTMVVCGDSMVTCRQMARDVFDVGGVPTMVFLQRNGTIIGPMVGYRDAAQFAGELERLRDGVW